jgi:hypothetical protein
VYDLQEIEVAKNVKEEAYQFMSITQSELAVVMAESKHLEAELAELQVRYPVGIHGSLWGEVGVSFLFSGCPDEK